MRIFALSARESRADENGGIMKKKAPEKNNEMLREYDFSKGVRGKYARRYARGSNVVVLNPDVATGFRKAEPLSSPRRSRRAIIPPRKSPSPKNRSEADPPARYGSSAPATKPP